ncbi:hypothetical protein KAR26_02685 [Candidatus Parcubacteria bacterium]|nr:hypothetical protein [Candidatus Parcubacteria bacterium]
MTFEEKVERIKNLLFQGDIEKAEEEMAEIDQKSLSKEQKEVFAELKESAFSADMAEDSL